MSTPSLPTYADDPSVRETYVDTVQSITDGTQLIARIEFCVMRWDPENPTQMTRRVPVSRVVMHLGLAIGLRDQLNKLIGEAEQKGLLRSMPRTPESMQ